MTRLKTAARETNPVSKLKINFDKAGLHMCKNKNVSTVLQNNIKSQFRHFLCV